MYKENSLISRPSSGLKLSLGLWPTVVAAVKRRDTTPEWSKDSDTKQNQEQLYSLLNRQAFRLSLTTRYMWSLDTLPPMRIAAQSQITRLISIICEGGPGASDFSLHPLTASPSFQHFPFLFFVSFF